MALLKRLVNVYMTLNFKVQAIRRKTEGKRERAYVCFFLVISYPVERSQRAAGDRPGGNPSRGVGPYLTRVQ